MSTNMNFKQFCEQIKENILGNLPAEEYADASVSLNRITKNNGVNYVGLAIKKAGSNISPQIYLDSFYEDFLGGRPLDNIVSEIARLWVNHDVPEFDIAAFTDISKVRENIRARLVNRKANEKLFSDHPYLDFAEGIVEMFYIIVPSITTDEGIGSVGISNSIASELGLTVNELHNIAMENSRKEPVVLQNVFDTLNFYPDNYLESAEDLEEGVLYVLTNEDHIYGAAELLKEDVLSKISEKFGGDYYILPSSIHEVLVLSGEVAGTAADLTKMVREVNASAVSNTEVLSDIAYRYDVTTAKVVAA